MEFFDVTIATDDHNEDSVSVEPRQGIVVVNNGSTSASYVKVDETTITDYTHAGKEAHDQGEPSDNDGQRTVHNNSRVHIGGNKKIGDMQPPRGYRVRTWGVTCSIATP